jgi:hypothetical protein
VTIRRIPVDSQRTDWPRLVAQGQDSVIARLTEHENLRRISRAKLRFVSG